MNIILGVSGGIAAYKAALLLRLYKEAGHTVRVMPTAASLEFVGIATWEALSGQPVTTSVFQDVDSVAHVELGKAAQLIVVAPATADFLARVASGRADDLLTASILTATCPVVLAPAMHTEMWLNPATQANIATLKSRGIHIIEPASGRLTGADTGMGRLPEPSEIYTQALAIAQPRQDLAGRHVVISAGGTQEPLDPVRFLGNHSSGLQGVELAREAASRGANVTLVAANITVAVPASDRIEVTVVGTALEMEKAITGLAPTADIIIMAAAVADFRPQNAVDQKIKKETDHDVMTLTLVKNPDILAGLVRNRTRAGQKIVGFAAETGDKTATVLDHGIAKAKRKGADLLVVNEVGAQRGFGQPTNDVVFVSKTGVQLGTFAGTKREISAEIFHQILKLT